MLIWSKPPTQEVAVPSKTLVRQIDMEIGEARQGIAQLEAEVTRLRTAREALVPSETNGKATAKPRRTTRRKTTAGRKATSRRKTTTGRAKQAATRRAPGAATRMVAESLLRMNGEPFTVPAFYGEHGKGNWNELTTFNIFKRLMGQGMLEQAGKDGNVQLWRVKDREKLGELVAA